MSISPTAKKHKRMKVIRSCPNPLFIQWLTEWRDEAVSKNLKTKYVYDKALRSMKKYPLPLQSGQEAKILEYCGDKICEMLDKKLEKHYYNNGQLPVNDFGAPAKCDPDRVPPATCQMVQPKSSLIIQKTTDTIKQSNKKSREYIPTFKSGPYAILLALHKLANMEHNIGVKKDELISAAQPLCDKSLTVPDHGSYYTAWSSIKTLIQKGLVNKVSNPARYSLTDGGHELVIKILCAEKESGDYSLTLPSTSQTATAPSQLQGAERYVDYCHTDPPAVSTGSLPSRLNGSTHFILYPGQFDVVLCVDHCETVSGLPNERKLQIQSELRKNGINFDVRKLHVGDFLWVARERVEPLPGHLHLPTARELVLDYIVERKRKDDLVGSITDGRFKEQKFRIKQSGLKHPIYLVEEYGSKNHWSIPESTLKQAIINTQVVDGFLIKHTKDLGESVAYLTLMTRYLRNLYSHKILQSWVKEGMSDSFKPGRECDVTVLITFDEFNKNAMKAKPISITEMFLKQLLQVQGISVEKGKAIIDLYPTPHCLLRRYEECSSEKEKELLLASIAVGKSQRNLGPALSKVLCHLYTRELLR